MTSTNLLLKRNIGYHFAQMFFTIRHSYLYWVSHKKLIFKENTFASKIVLHFTLHITLSKKSVCAQFESACFYLIWRSNTLQLRLLSISLCQNYGVLRTSLPLLKYGCFRPMTVLKSVFSFGWIWDTKYCKFGQLKL